jgi:hypothetical protein
MWLAAKARSCEKPFMWVHGMSVVPALLEPLQNEVTVYVLLGLKTIPNWARFFVTKNSDMETELSQPPYWRDFGFIDVEASSSSVPTPNMAASPAA